MQDEITRSVRAHRALAAVPGAGPFPPARMLARCLRLSVDLYRHADLR